MTSELFEVENHYLVLSHLLIRQVARKHPQLVEELKQVLLQLDSFSVFEKTAFLGEIVDSLEDQEIIQRQHQLSLVLKDENISDNTIGLLKKYNHWIK